MAMRTAEARREAREARRAYRETLSDYVDRRCPKGLEAGLAAAEERMQEAAATAAEAAGVLPTTNSAHGFYGSCDCRGWNADAMWAKAQRSGGRQSRERITAFLDSRRGRHLVDGIAHMTQREAMCALGDGGVADIERCVESFFSLEAEHAAAVYDDVVTFYRRRYPDAV